MQAFNPAREMKYGDRCIHFADICEAIYVFQLAGTLAPWDIIVDIDILKRRRRISEQGIESYG